MKKLSTHTLLSNSAGQTRKIGEHFAQRFAGGEIVLLSGCLGAGKTVLAKGIAQGLGIPKDQVTSPSFVLLRIHKGKFFLHHFDLYRLKSPEDILSLGYEEYFYSQGITLIEWPERLKFLLPKEFLKIKLSPRARNQRLLQFVAKGARYKQLLGKISEDIRV